MITPSVHIVILNWNSYQDSADCLRSLGQLEYPSYKVWVVDNASANQEAQRLAEEFPWAGILPQSQNLGFCGGCNEGMKKALEEKAELVMLLNNDTLVPPGLLSDLVNGYNDLAEPGAVSPLIMHYPEKEKIWFSEAIWSTDWRSGMAAFKLTNGRSVEELKRQGPYKTEFACGCCLMVSAAIIRKVGLFDERYFAYFDEAEWCVRMKKAGFDAFVIPAAHMFHKVGATTPSLVMTYLMYRNRSLWISGNLSLKRKLQALPAILKDLGWHGLNIVGLIPASKRTSDKAYSRAAWRGVTDFLMGRFGKWNKKTEKIIFPRS